MPLQHTVNGPSTLPRWRSNRRHHRHREVRHAPPRLPRRPQAPLGKMGLRNSGAAQKEPHMVGVFSGARDGGSSVRRRSVLPQGSEGAAQLPRRGGLPAASAVPHGQGHSGRGGPGGAHDESGWQWREKQHCRWWRRQRRRRFLGRDWVAGADGRRVLLGLPRGILVDHLRRHRRLDGGGAFAAATVVPGVSIICICINGVQGLVCFLFINL